MVQSVLSGMGSAAKTARIGAIKTVGDIGEAVLEASRKLLAAAIEGVEDMTVAADSVGGKSRYLGSARTAMNLGAAYQWSGVGRRNVLGKCGWQRPARSMNGERR
jgi:hypothetical protein